MDSTESLKIAVLVNSPPDKVDFWLDVRQSWKEAFATVCPTAQVNFYDPVVERKFPDASEYDLVVLSGGKADASCSEPWVLGVLDYVRNTVQNFPRTKILGICWGHQAVSRALGGEVRAVDTGPIVSRGSLLVLIWALLTTLLFAGCHWRNSSYWSRQGVLLIRGSLRTLCNFFHTQ